MERGRVLAMGFEKQKEEKEREKKEEEKSIVMVEQFKR